MQTYEKHVFIQQNILDVKGTKCTSKENVTEEARQSQL